MRSPDETQTTSVCRGLAHWRELPRRSGWDSRVESPLLSPRGENLVMGGTRLARTVSFGEPGMHGYRSLEGTFLGGCLITGRVAGRAVAESVL